MKSILLLVLLIFVLFVPWLVFADEVDCPFGIVDEASPGSCARHVDANNNDLCDLSEHNLISDNVSNDTEVVAGTSKKLPRYQTMPIAVTLLFFYLLTYILVLKKKMKVLTMRRIWNSVLLFSFLASAVLGLFLIMRINKGFVIPLPFNTLYWHVELGTVMALVTLFHLTWHWRFYTSMLRSIKN